MSDEIYYWLALSLVEGIGPITAKRLITAFSTPEKVFQASIPELVSIEGLGLKTAKDIKSQQVFSKADKEKIFIERHGVKVLHFLDSQFPSRLKDCPDAPFILFTKGKCPCNEERILSIVGTRKISPYAHRVLDTFIDLLAHENVVVVSGMASGVDTVAHRNVISHNGATIGVLGHGLHMIYPSTNKTLAKETLEKGGLITEYNSQSKIMPGHFPRRNRIIAGISDAMLVVETGTKGGAMISANYAHQYKRQVFAIPGSVFSPQSDGCHLLIQQNKAKLISHASQLLNIMGWSKSSRQKNIQTQLFPILTEPEQTVMKILQNNPEIHIDSLTQQFNSLDYKLHEILLQLELHGLILSLPGKRFRAI